MTRSLTHCAGWGWNLRPNVPKTPPMLLHHSGNSSAILDASVYELHTRNYSVLFQASLDPFSQQRQLRIRLPGLLSPLPVPESGLLPQSSPAQGGGVMLPLRCWAGRSVLDLLSPGWFPFPSPTLLRPSIPAPSFSGYLDPGPVIPSPYPALPLQPCSSLILKKLP